MKKVDFEIQIDTDKVINNLGESDLSLKQIRALIDTVLFYFLSKETAIYMLERIFKEIKVLNREDMSSIYTLVQNKLEEAPGWAKTNE